MLQTMTDKMFWGNSIVQWGIVFGIIVGVFIVAKILYWIFGNIIKKATSKTKTKLDDLLVDMLEEPVVFAVIIFGIWYALGTLNFSDKVKHIIGMGYQFLIVFNIAWFLVRFFDALVEEYLVPLVNKTEGDLDDQLLPIAKKGIKITIWALALIIGLNNAGYNIGALLAGLGIGGLAFALAAQDTVANLFGGFTIFTDRPFKIKDRVVVDGYDGVVEEIGIRSTRIRTLAGRLVTIPNSKIAGNVIENISSEPGRKVVLNLGLTYDTDDAGLEKAMEILKDLTEKNKDIENVSIAFNAFGDFALNILLIYWIKKDSDILGTQTALNLSILKKFNENKLEFAFPTQTIYSIEQKS